MALKKKWLIAIMGLILIFVIGNEMYSDKFFLNNSDYKNLNIEKYCYSSDQDIKKISYYIISNVFDDNISKKQRRLSIKESQAEIIVTGHTLGTIRELISFGGGGVVLVFKKNDNCLNLIEYYAEK